MDLEADILAGLRDPEETYDSLSRKLTAKHGVKVSRGRIWSVAVHHQARKHEARIRERATERRLRQKEALREILDATQTADVLDFLEGIPDESVQLHISSPPYNIGRSYGDGVSADRTRFHYYLGWLLQVTSEMCRTLRPGGVIFLQVGSTKDDAEARYPLDILLFEHLRAMGLVYQNRVMWRFPHGLTPKRRMAERYETALVFSKGEPAHFNADAVRVPQKEPDKRAFKGPNRGQLSGHPFGAHPVDVWEITNVGHNHPEKTGHPAQFPEELARRAVLLYTNPGEVVCDLFMGSGTVSVVAVRNGRHFLGCDLFYDDLRRKRLENVVEDAASRLPGVTRESVAVWAAEARGVRLTAASLQDFEEASGVSL